MKFVSKISFLALGLCLALSLQAQPKREFRASWLTTVWAIDWPASYNSNGSMEKEIAQQNELIAIIDSLAEANMNAVFFQVRGFSDAMYYSKYEPWSKYLTGERGKAPSYDPLGLLIEYAHEKGIEVHAWMNPYRYSSSEDTYGRNHPLDYHNTHPEWLVNCGGITILNPSLPEVRTQICRVVADLLENYDIDGVIFDDYFHQSGYLDSYDEAQYQATGNGMTRADWRRAQNNLMVRQVHDTIKAIKPWVSFGIGPAGKAGASADKYGVEHSPIGGDWQYNGIYADPLAWFNEKTIDYMAPQVYWKIGSTSDYDQLTRWWSDMACHFGRHMYVSQSLSELVKDDATVTQNSSKFHASEIVNQIKLNRVYDRMDAPGYCWYGLGTGLKTPNFIQNIRNNATSLPAIVPQMLWYHTDECHYVSNIKHVGTRLTWDAYKGLSHNPRYVVYAMPIDEVGKHGTIGTSKYLLGTTYSSFFDVSGIPAEYTFAVAVLDRYGNEFPARTIDNLDWGKSNSAELVYPADSAETLMPCNFTWRAVEGADSYFFQLSTTASFDTIAYEYEVTDTTFYIGKIYWLNNDGAYFWRVRTRSINKEDTYSDVYSYQGTYFRIQSPVEGDTTGFTPTLECDSVRYEEVEYTFEVSARSSFAQDDLVYVAISNSHRHTITDSLLASRNYYVRVIARFEGAEVTSDIVKFRTKAQQVPVPVILTPQTGDKIDGKSITVTWEKQVSSGFQVELSQQSDFPNRYTKRFRTDYQTYTYTADKLEAGTWYIRVRAAAEGGYTEPSNVVIVELMDDTPVEDVLIPHTPTKLLKDGQLRIFRNGECYDLLGNTYNMKL